MLLFRKDPGEVETERVERRQAQLQRLLREFPWMWAVNSSWSFPSSDISVENIDSVAGSNSVCSPRYKAFGFWVKVSRNVGTVFPELHEVKKVIFDRDSQPMATAAEAIVRNTLLPQEEIDYIVHKLRYTWGDGYFIFRAPRRSPESLRQMCERWARTD